METLAVGQSVQLRPWAPRPRHPEEQRVRLDHVRVAGFKLAAGNQQGGNGARLCVKSGAAVWVQRNLLFPCRDVLHWTTDILHRSKHGQLCSRAAQTGNNTSTTRLKQTKKKKNHKNVHTSNAEIPTHLPLLVTNFDQQNLQRHRVLLVLTVLR